MTHAINAEILKHPNGDPTGQVRIMAVNLPAQTSMAVPPFGHNQATITCELDDWLRLCLNSLEEIRQSPERERLAGTMAFLEDLYAEARQADRNTQQ